MNLQDILNIHQGRFLMLGMCPDELKTLKAAKWPGIVVCPEGTFGAKGLSDDDYYGDILYIEGHLSHETHFVRTMGGFWNKPLTVKEVFFQWGAYKFDLIMIDVPMQTRILWYSDQIQVHMPKYHMLKDDGHNEGVIDQARTLHYNADKMEGDWLLLSK